MKKKQKREVRRFAEYMVSGGAQFWSGYASFAVLFSFFQMNFWWAKSLSYFLGVSVNFILERFWVFKRKNISKKQIETSATKFYILMLVNFVLDLAIVGGLYEIFNVTPYIGQFISAGFFTVWNYLLFKLWVFARRRSPGSSKSRPSRSRKAKPGRRHA